MCKLILPIILFISIPFISRSQKNRDKPSVNYSVAELKEDFFDFRSKLEKYHPLLYLYNSKQIVDSAFDYLYNSIDKPMTDLGFYSHITAMMEVIKDGHNLILPGKSTIDYYNNNGLFLPLTIHSDGDKLYSVAHCTSDGVIKDGAEIISINGMPAKDILIMLLTRQPRDGYNETYPRWIINKFFRGFYSFLFGHPDQFNIVCKESNSEKNADVKAMTLDSIRYYRIKNYPETEHLGKGIVLDINNRNQSAILSIPSFDNNTYKKEYKQAYAKTIRRSFKLIREKKIQSLAIDIRGNQGGNPVYVRKLLVRLMENKFTMAISAGKVKNEKESVWEKRNKKKFFPWYAIGSFKPKKNSFKGKLYVLIDGGTYSAAGQFSSVIEKYKRALFVGEETGGNKSIIGGYFIKQGLILPHTKLEISPARLYTFYRDPVSNNGHGVYPDHPVKQTVVRVVKGEDPVKDFVRSLFP